MVYKSAPQPTPEEIAEACRLIREGWSEEKWNKQTGAVAWEVPRQKVPTLKSRVVK